MMDEPAGPTLMDETIQDAISFRKAMSSIAHRLRAAEHNGDGWFFRLYQPEIVVDDPAHGESYLFEEAPTPSSATSSSCWTLKPGEDWHGYQDEDIADDYCMLDPTKVTILTPGVNAQGSRSPTGASPPPSSSSSSTAAASRSPAPATTPSSSSSPSAPPRASGARCSKTSSSSSASTTPTPPSKRPSPSSSPNTPTATAASAATPSASSPTRCTQAMIELNLAGLVNAACDEDFDPVLTPAQTYQKLVRGQTEKIRFRDMAGRIAAVMLVPYPPGIPMSMPGERLGSDTSPVIKLILAMEEFGQRFPGFERETHGIEVDADGNYWMRAVCEEEKSKKKTKKKGSRKPPPSNAPPVNKQRLKIKPIRRSTE